MIWPLALGGLAGVDRTAFGQTMLAHPVVCGTLAGWVSGDPAHGLRAGIVLGMLAARRSPIGGAGPIRDWTSAAIVIPFALGSGAAGWQWGLGLVFAVAVALGGGWAIQAVRAVAARREPAVLEAAGAGALGPLERHHLTLLGLHFLRGALVVALAAPLLARLAYGLRWSGPEQSASALIWGFAPVSGAAVLLLAHLRHSGRWPVLTGALAASALLLLARVGS